MDSAPARIPGLKIEMTPRCSMPFIVVNGLAFEQVEGSEENNHNYGDFRNRACRPRGVGIIFLHFTFERTRI